MSFEKMTIAELRAYLEEKEDLLPEEEERLKADHRRGTAALLRRFHKRKDASRQEEARLQKMLSEEESLQKKGFEAIAGVDEAGRGPLAGPVIAAAVILKPGVVIKGLKDSKQLSAEAREKIFDQIIINVRSYGLGSASREEIDRLNIHAASMLAMMRALGKLSPQPDYVLVDGFQIRKCPFKQKAITGGDVLSMSIAAASVLAKVSRDKVMLDLHRKYPRYGFDHNMGYGTSEHRDALSRFGPCPLHRLSFRLTDN